MIQSRWVNEPAFGVLGLGPRVWIEQKHPIEASIGQKRQKCAGIVVQNPDILERRSRPLLEQRRDSILKDFGTDKADLRVCLRLRR